MLREIGFGKLKAKKEAISGAGNAAKIPLRPIPNIRMFHSSGGRNLSRKSASLVLVERPALRLKAFAFSDGDYFRLTLSRSISVRCPPTSSEISRR